MIKYLKILDEWARCKCGCGKEFEVDACFQENLIYVNNVLHAQCPFCLYVEGSDCLGCLRFYTKLDII